MIQYLEATAKCATNRYLNTKKKNASDMIYYNFWIKFHVFNKNRMTKFIKKDLTVKLTKYIQYLHNSVQGLIDLDIWRFEHLLKTNVDFANHMNKLFAKKHNQLLRAARSTKKSIRDAIETTIQQTTQKIYKFWRRKVCEYIMPQIYIQIDAIDIFDINSYINRVVCKNHKSVLLMVKLHLSANVNHVV